MNKRIYNYSLHLLAKQDYSEFKLRVKLLSKKNNEKDEVEQVLRILKEKNYLREDQYKKSFIKKWLSRGESPQKIKQRGKQERLEINEDDFEEPQTSLNITPEDNLKKLVQKKLRGVAISDINDHTDSTRKLRDKILRFLISKGYSFEEGLKAIKEYVE